MSLVQKNSTQSRKQARKSNRRPEWDSTIGDVSEHRATPEEVARRQEAHRSKNLELVRKSAIEKRIAAANRRALSDASNRPTTNAFLREILYNDGDVSRLLDDTSKALQVARDVFGDDAKKYKAVPAITAVASDDEENLVYTRQVVPDGLIKACNEPQTRLEKLSDSVMKKKALNETFSAPEDGSSSSDDEDQENRPAVRNGNAMETTPAGPVFPTRLDLQRFQKLLEAEDLSTIASEPSLQPAANQKDRVVRDQPVLEAKQQATGQHMSDSTRHAGRVKKDETKRSSKHKHRVQSADPTDLKTLLLRLDNELRSYDALYPTLDGSDLIEADQQTDGSISTYTVTLINSLRRMVSFFHQIQGRLMEEKRQRSIKDQQLQDLTHRTDLLTTELINTQEQFHVVLDELNRVKTEQRDELDELKATVRQLSKGGVVHSVTVDHPKQSKLLPTNTSAKTSPQYTASHGVPAMTLRQSTSPAMVRIHQEFEGSPEQQRLLGQSNPAIPDMRRSVDMPIRQRPNSATDMWRPSSANGVIRPGSAADIMRPHSAAGTSDIANVMRANNVQSPSKHDRGTAEGDLTLEQRIEQLRGDHQQTLERFRKLGMELQKENPTGAPSWLTDAL